MWIRMHRGISMLAALCAKVARGNSALEGVLPTRAAEDEGGAGGSWPSRRARAAGDGPCGAWPPMVGGWVVLGTPWAPRELGKEDAGVAGRAVAAQADDPGSSGWRHRRKGVAARPRSHPFGLLRPRAGRSGTGPPGLAEETRLPLRAVCCSMLFGAVAPTVGTDIAHDTVWRRPMCAGYARAVMSKASDTIARVGTTPAEAQHACDHQIMVDCACAKPDLACGRPSRSTLTKNRSTSLVQDYPPMLGCARHLRVYSIPPWQLTDSPSVAESEMGSVGPGRALGRRCSSVRILCSQRSSTFGQTRPIAWPARPNIDRQKSYDFGNCLANVARTWSSVLKSWPQFVKRGPVLATIGRCSPGLGQTLAEIDQRLADFGQHGHTLTTLGQ